MIWDQNDESLLRGESVSKDPGGNRNFSLLAGGNPAPLDTMYMKFGIESGEPIFQVQHGRKKEGDSQLSKILGCSKAMHTVFDLILDLSFLSLALCGCKRSYFSVFSFFQVTGFTFGHQIWVSEF